MVAEPLVELVLADVPDVPVAEVPAGELLEVPLTAPLAPPEGLAELLVLVRVLVAPPALNVTAPVASCTLSGGGGTVMEELVPVVVDVLLVPVARLLLAPVAPLLLVAPTPAELLVAPVADVPEDEVLPLALHCGLAAAPVPVVAAEELDDTGATLVRADGAPAAVLVLGEAEAPVLVGGADPGAAPPPAQAASTSEATASVGSSAFNDMDSSACPS